MKTGIPGTNNHLLIISTLLAHVTVSAQNVGIGINTPLNRLHILSSSSTPLRVESTLSSSSNIVFYTSTNAAASIGGFNNRVEVMAFNSRNLVLGTNGFNQVFLTTAGYLGIGTETPPERLTVSAGNIHLLNTDKGIILNSADRPLITRGFDAFTSGNYNGLGRWGIFMEPSRLTFGIPGIAGKAFEWASYNASSTRNTLMTLNEQSQLKRPDQGGVDLLPIAIGSLTGTGGILGGSGNFSVTTDNNGAKDITISGITYNDEQYAAIVTCRQIGVTSFAMTQAVSGKLRILTYNDGGTLSNRPVHFVVYKLF